jgi:hypothetical protein
MALRLKWRRSFPDSQRDFTANIEGRPMAYARVYFTVANTTYDPRWIWAADEQGNRGEGRAADKACKAGESALLGPDEA